MRPKDTFGERLHDLRKDNNVRQEDVAAAIGISRSKLGNYEREENAPSLETIVKLADYFSVSVDYLLCRIESKFDTRILTDEFSLDATYEDFLLDATGLDDFSRRMLAKMVKFLKGNEMKD